MSFLQFPDIQRVLVFETSTTMPLVKFQLNEKLELVYIPLRILKVGTAGGSESMTLKVWGSENYNGTPIATSSAYSLAGISGLTTNWIGDIRFDFARQNLGANVWYYLTIDVANYTRNGTTFYLSAVQEWPFTFNTITTFSAGARAVYAGYKEQT
jgi:hypothetical protein